jgi:predicted lysophospholipase L1 biosynthesis ABC-type transport system permease subunit
LLAAGLLLVIACANVANLVLARATTRRKGLAIRAAIGASSGRLVRLLLTESIVLSVAGGLIGLLLAPWSIDFLGALASEQIPRLRSLQFDGAVFLFTVAATAGAGLLFGLVPALQGRRADLNQTLKNAGDRVSTCTILSSGTSTSITESATSAATHSRFPVIATAIGRPSFTAYAATPGLTTKEPLSS